MSEDLRRRVVLAVGATSFGNGLAKIISLVSTLVMVRLLTPGDFGLIAIATTVTGLVGFFNEVGLGAAIVQRTDLRKEEVNGCFGIALVASAMLCAIVFALSWPAAVFFELPALQPVLAMLGLGFFFGALDTVPVAMLRRELRFQSVLWCSVTATLVQSLTAIPLAYFGLGYWSIVIAFFVGQTVAVIWYWLAAGWRPSWPLGLRHGAALIGYGLNITYSRILWHVYMNIDKLILGKLLGVHAVGVYDVSKSLASLPTSQISGMVTGIASPVFARLQTDMPRLQAVQLRLTRGIAYLTFPALLGIAAVANELVLVLLGAKWQEAVMPLRALCISEMVATVANLQSQLLISSGHVKRLVAYSAACALVMPIAITAGAWAGGLAGVALAWALVYPLLSLWLFRQALNVSGLRFPDLWRALRQPLLGALAMLAAMSLLRLPLLAQGLPPVVTLVACITVGSLVYLAFLIYIDRDGMAEIRQVLTDFGVPAGKLDRWPFTRAGAKKGAA